MDWKFEPVMARQSILTAFLGGSIGWKRDQHGREIGTHTFAADHLGAYVIGLICLQVLALCDKTRIAAQVVSGASLLGVEVILRHRGRVNGLTTAATLWAKAAVGLAIAFSMYALGVLTALFIFALVVIANALGLSQPIQDPRS